MTFFIRPNGTVEVRYEPDAARVLAAAGGQLSSRRVGQVEPDEAGRWWADLRPWGGPRLGPFPHEDRNAALAAEAAWVEQHLRGQPDGPHRKTPIELAGTSTQPESPRL